MALGGTYSTGTLNVTNGSPTVPGTGVLWSDVVEGDWLQVGSAIGVINSVNVGYDQITLKDGWAGNTLVGSTYRILKMSALRYDPSLTQQKLREFLVDIEAAGLFLFVSGATPDSSLGEDGQYALKTNSGPWKLWYKSSGTWVSQGSPVGVNWKGVWNTGAYLVNDAVSRLGKSYISIFNGTNKPPESNPTYWDLQTAGGDRYDVAVYAAVQPDSGETLLQMIMSTAVTFNAGLSESKSIASIAATAQSVISLQKNGVGFATVTFAAAGTTGVFACASTTTFAAGDVLTVVAPSPRDNTLGYISLTITGFR